MTDQNAIATVGSDDNVAFNHERAAHRMWRSVIVEPANPAPEDKRTSRRSDTRLSLSARARGMNRQDSIRLCQRPEKTLQLIELLRFRGSQIFRLAEVGCRAIQLPRPALDLRGLPFGKAF